jgi:hypothetical protein
MGLLANVLVPLGAVLGVLLRILPVLSVVAGLAMERLVLGVDRAGTFGKFLSGVLPVRLVIWRFFRMPSLRGVLLRLGGVLQRVLAARAVVLRALSWSLVLSHGTSFHPLLH